MTVHHEKKEHDMSTEQTEPRVTLAAGGGYGYPTTETREVSLNLHTDTDQDDLSTGMKVFHPTTATIVYRRSWQEREGTWSPWLVRVHVRGPRRLTSGALSERSEVSATYRPDAAPDSVFAMPEYMRPAVVAWMPTTEESNP